MVKIHEAAWWSVTIVFDRPGQSVTAATMTAQNETVAATLREMRRFDLYEGSKVVAEAEVAATSREDKRIAMLRSALAHIREKPLWQAERVAALALKLDDAEAEPSTPCASCGSARTTECPELESFLYGAGGPDQVVLSAVVCVLRCSDCGNMTTDWRGELSREEAVRQHLASKSGV